MITEFKQTVSTWNILPQLGFDRDDSVISDDPPGLSLNFESFKLSAACLVNLYLQEMVIFWGIIVTPRTISEVDFQLPLTVDSVEQCEAFITYYLDQSAGGKFESLRAVEWLERGRKNRSLLPWEIQKTKYNNRPKCSVRKEWLKLGLKDLSEIISKQEKNISIYIDFDGNFLTFDINGEAVKLPATGSRWNSYYSVDSETLQHLPKQLPQGEIQVSVFESLFHIGRYAYKSSELSK